MNNIFAERLKKAMEQKNMKQIDLVKTAAEKGVKLGKRRQENTEDTNETWKESCEPVSEWKNNSQIRNS